MPVMFEILVLALVAYVLGLILGWMVWGGAGEIIEDETL